MRRPGAGTVIDNGLGEVAGKRPMGIAKGKMDSATD